MDGHSVFQTGVDVFLLKALPLVNGVVAVFTEYLFQEVQHLPG